MSTTKFIPLPHLNALLVFVPEVISLQTLKAVVLVVPGGDQEVPITMIKCACGCEQWFQPIETNQAYSNPEHRHAVNNAKQRKTDRKRGSAA